MELRVKVNPEAKTWNEFFCIDYNTLMKLIGILENMDDKPGTVIPDIMNDNSLSDNEKLMLILLLMLRDINRIVRVTIFPLLTPIR